MAATMLEQFEHKVVSAKSSNEVSAFLDFSHRPPTWMLFRQQVVYKEGNIIDAIEEIAWKIPGSLRLVNPNVPTFELSRRIGSQKRKLHGFFVVLPGSQPNVHRITTLSYSDFWNSGVKMVVSKLYPAASKLYFKQDEIKQALSGFEQEFHPMRRVRVSDVSFVEKRRGGDSMVGRGWPDSSIEDAFSLALERQQFVRSIQFYVEGRTRNGKYQRIAQCRLHKSGEMSNDFLFTDLNSNFLRELEVYSTKRLGLLKSKSRIEHNFAPGVPIAIEFDANLFSKPEEVRKLGKTIMSYKHATKAVFHSNPYYHVSIADFEDGSSMELYVLSPSRAVISPQRKTTEQALSRLISHIFLEYREGDVIELRK